MSGSGKRATSRDRSLPEKRVSIKVFPISPEFLTLLAPVTDNEAQPEEDQPQHEAPNTTQHLALGRFRLCPWGAEPGVSICLHIPQCPLRILKSSLRYRRWKYQGNSVLHSNHPQVRDPAKFLGQSGQVNEEGKQVPAPQGHIHNLGPVNPAELPGLGSGAMVCAVSSCIWKDNVIRLFQCPCYEV